MSLKSTNTFIDVISWLPPFWPLFLLEASGKKTPSLKANQSTFTKTILEKALLPALGVPYYSKNITSADKPYIDKWEIYLVDHWGLADDFSEKAAEAIVLFSKYGLRPVITSGYRSTEKQTELYNRWLKGDKTIFTPAKPGTSPHERTNWIGQPAARCFDCQVSNYQTAARIAQNIGIAFGYPADPVHFGELSRS